MVRTDSIRRDLALPRTVLDLVDTEPFKPSPRDTLPGPSARPFGMYQLASKPSRPLVPKRSKALRSTRDGMERSFIRFFKGAVGCVDATHSSQVTRLRPSRS